MRGEDPFKPVTQSLWDPQARLAALDEFGIEIQIISATPILFGYLSALDEAKIVSGIVNDLASNIVRQIPSG